MVVLLQFAMCGCMVVVHGSVFCVWYSVVFHVLWRWDGVFFISDGGAFLIYIGKICP